MKKRILSIALCVVLSFCLSSCDQISSLVGETDTITNETSAPIDDNDPYTFETVAELKAAIKKYPSQYENAQITVKGTTLRKNGSLHLVNGHFGSGMRYELEMLQSPHITISMSDEKLTTLLENGDYVKIIGIVTISDVEVYLDNCNYEMIESIYE